MAAILSQADVDGLLDDPTARTRAGVATSLGRNLDSPILTGAQLEMAQDIVRIMARDVEVTVRAALSESLCQTRRLPHDIAVLLANDVDAVALPILRSSLVLTDDDLLEIVSHSSMTRQSAIAGRPHVSEPLAAALVSGGDEATVSTLVHNPRARISERSLGEAIDRFPASDPVQTGIVHRVSLPITITERLVALVSEELQDYLVAHHKLPPDMASELALRSRERATLLFSNGLGVEHVGPLVTQMRDNGRLTPDLVLRALCLGDMPFFEAAMAALAKVPVQNAGILIHDAGPVGFSRLYAQSGLPGDLLSAFKAAREVVDSTRLDGEAHDMERFRSRVITRVLTQVDSFPAADVDYLVDRLGDVLSVA